jgi:hypothetical protein
MICSLYIDILYLEFLGLSLVLESRGLKHPCLTDQHNPSFILIVVYLVFPSNKPLLEMETGGSSYYCI